MSIYLDKEQTMMSMHCYFTPGQGPCQEFLGLMEIYNSKTLIITQPADDDIMWFPLVPPAP